VVVADQLGRDLEERDAGDELVADERVGAHDAPFGRGERSRLVQDRFGNTDLAGVVQQEPVLGGPLLVANPELTHERHAVDAAPFEMLTGVRVLCFDDERQRPHGAQVGGLQLVECEFEFGGPLPFPAETVAEFASEHDELARFE